jgi:hypothetical protein
MSAYNLLAQTVSNPNDVRFWRKANMAIAISDVRFWGNSGHCPTSCSRRDEARPIAAARQQIFWKRARQRGTLTGGST